MITVFSCGSRLFSFGPRALAPHSLSGIDILEVFGVGMGNPIKGNYFPSLALQPTKFSDYIHDYMKSMPYSMPYNQIQYRNS
jgi:hypothetical protein